MLLYLVHVTATATVASNLPPPPEPNHLQYTANLHNAPFLPGIGSGHRQLIAVTCIAEHASAATYTTANAVAKRIAQDRARCRALQESESGGY